MATGCATVDDFVAAFNRFCEKDSFFVATQTKRDNGTELVFQVVLTDGEKVLRGLGPVVQVYTRADSPFRVPGIQIGIQKLTPSSAKMFARLREARTVAQASAARPKIPAPGERAQGDAGAAPVAPVLASASLSAATSMAGASALLSRKPTIQIPVVPAPTAAMTPAPAVAKRTPTPVSIKQPATPAPRGEFPRRDSVIAPWTPPKTEEVPFGIVPQPGAPVGPMQPMTTMKIGLITQPPDRKAPASTPAADPTPAPSPPTPAPVPAPEAEPAPAPEQPALPRTITRPTREIPRVSRASAGPILGERTPHSDYILPANPLTDFGDDAIGSFIDNATFLTDGASYEIPTPPEPPANKRAPRLESEPVALMAEADVGIAAPGADPKVIVAPVLDEPAVVAAATMPAPLPAPPVPPRAATPVPIPAPQLMPLAAPLVPAPPILPASAPRLAEPKLDAAAAAIPELAPDQDTDVVVVISDARAKTPSDEHAAIASTTTAADTVLRPRRGSRAWLFAFVAIAVLAVGGIAASATLEAMLSPPEQAEPAVAINAARPAPAAAAATPTAPELVAPTAPAPVAPMVAAPTTMVAADPPTTPTAPTPVPADPTAAPAAPTAAGAGTTAAPDPATPTTTAATDPAPADEPAPPDEPESDATEPTTDVATATTPGRAASCRLAVKATPVGSPVRVDGHYVGTSPVVISTSCRRHKVAITRSQYETQTRVVKLRAGKTSGVSVQLKKATTLLSITTSPGGASVYVDGHVIGFTPASIRVLTGTQVAVKIVKPGYAPVTRTVNSSKKTEKIAVNLALK